MSKSKYGELVDKELVKKKIDAKVPIPSDVLIALSDSLDGVLTSDLSYETKVAIVKVVQGVLRSYATLPEPAPMFDKKTSYINSFQ